MQNSTFFVLLRPIFAPKMKTAPPKGFGSRSCEGFAVVWTRIEEFFGSGAQPRSVKTFFFRDHLFLARKTLGISDFGRKNPSNFGKDLFFIEIT